MKFNEPVPPKVETITEGHRKGDTEESHPAFAIVGASRVTSNPGAALFDSDILHSSFIRVEVKAATRTRSLSHDWIHETGPNLLVIDMSEAQWASFVSSMNTAGVPCTLRAKVGAWNVPGLVHAPRLGESIKEVKGAFDKAFAHVKETYDAYAEKKTVRNLKSLGWAIDAVANNGVFVAESLGKHAENVVQKAKADVESMVVAKAAQLGLGPGDALRELGLGGGETPELER